MFAHTETITFFDSLLFMNTDTATGNSSKRKAEEVDPYFCYTCGRDIWEKGGIISDNPHSICNPCLDVKGGAYQYLYLGDSE